jgi:hypothetical protein
MIYAFVTLSVLLQPGNWSRDSFTICSIIRFVWHYVCSCYTSSSSYCEVYVVTMDGFGLIFEINEHFQTVTTSNYNANVVCFHVDVCTGWALSHSSLPSHTNPYSSPLNYSKKTYPSCNTSARTTERTHLPTVLLSLQTWLLHVTIVYRAIT